MELIILDFETYFDTVFTLKKLTTEAYIRDQRFSVHGVGVRFESGRKLWVSQSEVPQFFAQFDWANTAVIAHHAQFDGLILSHHYGVMPAFWFCTMSMARMWRGHHKSVALAKLAEDMGLAEKSVPYQAMLGVRWENMALMLRDELARGCLHDCDLTWAVFQGIIKLFPREELKLIDLTVRMFTEPALEGDITHLERIKLQEWTNKAHLLEDLGVGKKDLQSSEKFMQLLESEGVDVEWKTGKNGPIPAIAATDEFMKGLLEDDNPRVAALAAARLEVRSTIDETRSGRLAGMAQRGPLTVYLNYWGAHTGRWSGGDKVNLQNLPRNSDLRKCITAPKGHVLSVVDAAQIECRLLNAFAGQWDVVEAFRKGEDLYSRQAEAFYGRPVNKRDNPTERHLGKTLELGCGYGMGAAKLRVTCKRGALGGPPIELSEDEAQHAIDTYRRTHPQVVHLWRTAEKKLLSMCEGYGSVEWNCLGIDVGMIKLPNGSILHYPELRRAPADETSLYPFWEYKTRKGYRKTYGGKLVENIIQALARLATAQAMIRVAAQGIKIATMSHDETVCVLPMAGAEQAHEFIIQEMRRPLLWLPECPLDAEGILTERYTK